MELKSLFSSHFLHAGNDLAFSSNQIPYSVPLLLTGNTATRPITQDMIYNGYDIGHALA
jgi:hypothetical protein